ncbi:MAG: hypothetical protein ACOYKC_03415 [Anaerolineaceae bacterium]|jgi:hypothetical protein
MKNKKHIIKLIIAIILVFGISVLQHSSSAIADLRSEGSGPTNKIYIDVTYDPSTQTYSLGGFSSAELSKYGAPDFTPEVWQILANLDQVNIKLEGEELNIILNEEQLANMAWDANSRQLLFALINAYIDIGKIDIERAEAWLDKSNIEISLRNTKELSDPLLIELATLLQVKVYDSGAIRVEGRPIGYAMTPEMLALLKAANVNGLKLCWNKGVISTSVNVDELRELPQISLFEGGVNVLDKAFGLNLGDLSPLFNSEFGAGIVIGDADPITGECLP